MPANRREAEARTVSARAFAEAFLAGHPGNHATDEDCAGCRMAELVLALLDSQQGGVWLSKEEMKQVRVAILDAPRLNGGPIKVHIADALALLDSSEQPEAGDEG